MADWRQTQARIRKAKTSSDPAAQLAELFERTRDAMVAFELAQWHEKAGNAGETVRWYTTAAQRFRRAQWRTKAEEALTRLGAPIPEPMQAAEHAAEASSAAVRAHPAADAAEPVESSQHESSPPYPRLMDSESEGLHAGNGREPLTAATSLEATESAEDSGVPSTPAAAAAAAAGKRRRRGRRGGRKRRGRGAGEPGAPAGAPAERSADMRRGSPPAVRAPFQGRVSGAPAAENAGIRPSSPEPESQLEQRRAPMESRAEARSLEEEHHDRPAAWQGGTGGLVSNRSRAGDPGLSSRIAQLESQLRRMLACPLAVLDDADQAPAGPGVLLLSDSDQVTHYYVEACQTLRIGIGNLLRGGRGSKGGAQLKPSLAEHLGINESRVAKYLKDHCTVRWIQLDEGAPELAHFATAVLRPVVAE
jgi:hypothetical protein